MTVTNQSVLKVAGMGVSYGGVQAISRFDFEVKQGEFVAVLGPSGCGKSSMLNVISGLLEPTRGEVTVNGRPLYGEGRQDPKLGYVFQNHRLLPWRTVKQNLELALASSDVPRERWDRNIDEMLRTLHISQFKDAWPLQLSGGQRQRVSIARAILVEPSYILMDEPLSTLDEVTARSLREELSAISRRTGTTIMFVTHSIREAVYLADRIIILTRGPSNVFEDYSVPIEKPRDYDDPRIGEVERDIINRVKGVWGMKRTERTEDH